MTQPQANHNSHVRLPASSCRRRDDSTAFPLVSRGKSYEASLTGALAPHTYVEDASPAIITAIPIATASATTASPHPGPAAAPASRVPQDHRLQLHQGSVLPCIGPICSRSAPSSCSVSRSSARLPWYLRSPREGLVLRCVGVASCPLSNRARCRRLGLGEREEQLFFESPRARRPLDLVSRASRYGLTSLRPFSRSAQAAPSAQRISTSAATASLRMRHSWSCSTNYGRASGRDILSLLSLPETGVNPVPQGGQRVTCAKTPRSGAHPVMPGSQGFESLTAAIYGSGGGLGIQQPGSMTCGFAIMRQPASGRADESAKCPAVARNYRRAA